MSGNVNNPRSGYQVIQVAAGVQPQCSEAPDAHTGPTLLELMLDGLRSMNWEEAFKLDDPQAPKPWPRDCPLCQESFCSLLCPYLRAAEKKRKEEQGSQK
ncbi:hypothetical protein BT63DRAFT_455570 [Microthyrium microscopicum]|uniref:Uncharacterized protein n=1 Tax=Microthyrium microscopicum TaxID=703497 RepID=A0A6A6UBT2_9PEZI|nr:hypothetical protein BT63DRAFT_455570 [Microthyrium microscopicum]